MLRFPMGMRRLFAAFVLAATVAAPVPARASEATLRVGTSGDYAPFSVASPGAPGGVDGFDGALARA